MENDTLVFLIIMATFGLIIYWVFKPERCPKCGRRMLRYYEIETGEVFIECPKCGHRIGGSDA